MTAQTDLEAELFIIQAALKKEEGEILKMEDIWNDFCEQNEHLIKDDSVSENEEEE